ncbi:methionine--tRNA ligase [Plasmodium gonderi]|uniref:methionine--tRNA ligase n=1 Tax=Plasmodium gonderi TaxID=77519 RepID=A0A1Y1JJ43_PLAGO|nr:methionine--tRNA ligase [Plasmodium gonderi]GAW80473.1 methionine--tRNA ligase [Plasmodium gonderi]
MKSIPSTIKIIILISVLLINTFKTSNKHFCYSFINVNQIDLSPWSLKHIPLKEATKKLRKVNLKRRCKYRDAYVRIGKDYIPFGYSNAHVQDKKLTFGNTEKGYLKKKYTQLNNLCEASSVELNLSDSTEKDTKGLINTPNKCDKGGEANGGKANGGEANVGEVNGGKANGVAFVSTPVYYGNDKPHIGHAYCNILSDTICRFLKWECKKRDKFKVVLFSGMDEHGLKIEKKSKEMNIRSIEHINNMCNYYKMMNEKLYVHTDIFYRTSNKFHKSFVQCVWNYLIQNGYIYKDVYKGYYDINEEKYLNDFELKKKNKINNPNVIYIEEENCYFFNILKFQNFLIHFYQHNKSVIYPTYLQKDILHFIKNDLKNICISRYNTKWGINIPNEQKGTIYVWFDALLSYVSSVLYKVKKKRLVRKSEHIQLESDDARSTCSSVSACKPASSYKSSLASNQLDMEDEEIVCSHEDILSMVEKKQQCSEEEDDDDSVHDEMRGSNHCNDTNGNNGWHHSNKINKSDCTVSNIFEKEWNPFVQIIGKDILKFHAIFYICLLKSLNLKFPQKILCHGLLKSENVKMSKSVGNVISPFDILKKYEPDIIRLYFFGSGNIYEDKNFKETHLESFQLFVRNNIGNLLYRVVSLCLDNSYEYIFKIEENDFFHYTILRECENVKTKLITLIHNFEYPLFLENLMTLIKKVNKFFVHREPWNYTKDSIKFNKIIYETLECIKFFSVFLHPIIPRTSVAIFQNIGLNISPQGIITLDMLDNPTEKFVLTKLIKIV